MAKSSAKKWFGTGILIAGFGLIATALYQWRSDERVAPLKSPIERQRRSVLMITIDTTRADRLQPYGATDIATPTLLGLARNGILFEHAFSSAPITLVAHTSMLTGLHPFQHGVRNNGTHFVPEELDTLAEALGDSGYRTSAFVSAAVLEKRYGLDQGFELYDDDLSTGRERHPRVVADRPAEAVVDSATAWLDALDEGDRFFSWVHFYDPHAVYSPPPPYRDRYRDRLYDGEIAYMDSQIGRLLEHPRLQGENAPIVLVVGDHGESLGEHGEQTHAILAYDSTLHVPFIASIPGGPKGLSVRGPVGHVDLMPTVLDLLGLKFDAEDFSGRSLVPILESGVDDGPGQTHYSETHLPFYTYGWSKLQVARRGSWKYIDGPDPELYDLRRDPRELSNQIAEHPDVAHDLKRDLAEMTQDAVSEETSIELDSEAAEKLRSLGYLSVGSRRHDSGERPDPKAVIDLHVGLERARRMASDRLFDGAVRELRAVLSRDPENMAALTDLATSLEAKGNTEEAVKVIERALSIDPEYSRLHLQLAGLEARRGNRDKALELIDLALSFDPRSLEAKLQKSIQLQQIGRLSDAKDVLKETLAEHPDHPRVNTVYAQLVEVKEGDLEAAEKRLNRAIEIDPFLAQSRRVLGQLLERTQRPELAIETYREGLEKHPDDMEMHSRLGLLLARRSAETEAEVHLREALRLASQPRPELRVALGGWLADHGRLQEAEVQYEKVLGDDPKHPGARNNRAIAYFRTGRAEQAVSELESVVADYPQHADAHSNLAAIYLERGDWETTERHARLATESNARMPEAWNNLGVALEEQGKMKEALSSYENALGLAPDYWQALFNQAVLFRKTERFEEAESGFKAVVQQVPAYGESHLELGKLYAGPLDNAANARIHLNAFLRSTPQHPEAQAVKKLLSEL